MNEFWGKIGFGAKKKLILGQKRINFGVVKITSLKYAKA
jgi:hypothetical protein